MNSLDPSMNLSRFSTYNLACELKDQIREVERNWDADLQQLERAKTTRSDMQDQVRALQILLHQERETTANLERTLQETRFEHENPKLGTSFDSYEEANSLSSASVYSDSNFCLVYNQSAASVIRALDNPGTSAPSVAERDRSDPDFGLSVVLADPAHKPTRSAQWKQLIASFLPNAKDKRSFRPSPGSASSVLSTITSSGLNVNRSQRRLAFQASSPDVFSSSRDSDLNLWRGTAEAAGGRFIRRKTRSGLSDAGRLDDV